MAERLWSVLVCVALGMLGPGTTACSYDTPGLRGPSDAEPPEPARDLGLIPVPEAGAAPEDGGDPACERGCDFGIGLDPAPGDASAGDAEAEDASDGGRDGRADGPPGDAPLAEGPLDASAPGDSRPDDSLPDPCAGEQLDLGPHPCLTGPERFWHESLVPDYHPVSRCTLPEGVRFGPRCTRSAWQIDDGPAMLETLDHVLFVGDEMLLPPPVDFGRMVSDVDTLRRIVTRELMERTHLAGGRPIDEAAWNAFDGRSADGLYDPRTAHTRWGSFSVLAAPGLRVANAAEVLTELMRPPVEDAPGPLGAGEGEIWLVVITVGQWDLYDLVEEMARPRGDAFEVALAELDGELRVLLGEVWRLRDHLGLEGLYVLLSNPLPWEMARDGAQPMCRPWSWISRMRGIDYEADLLPDVLETWLRAAHDLGADLIFAREVMYGREPNRDGWFETQDGVCLFPDVVQREHLAERLVEAITGLHP